MKVLMTTDTVGGVWTYAMELGAALTRRGVTVELASMGRLPTQAQEREAAGAGVRLHASAYRLEWMEEPWQDVRDAGRWLLKLAGDLKPDLVHLNGYSHAALPWRVPVMVVAHSCVCTWWQAVHREEAPANWDRYRAHVQTGLAAADMVVAPTAAMLKAAQRCYGALDCTRVIHNGVEPSRYSPRDKEPFIFAAGRLWDQAKNIHMLERVKHDLNWPVCVAGDDQSPDGARRHYQLDCLGKLESHEMTDWLGRAAIYALPAKYEPFGLSILEAALSGCALVISNIPTLWELWADEAVFVDPDDAAGLRRSLRDLIADAPHRHWLGQRARRRALQLTTQCMVGEYLSAYQQLLPQKPQEHSRHRLPLAG